MAVHPKTRDKFQSDVGGIATRRPSGGKKRVPGVFVGTPAEHAAATSRPSGEERVGAQPHQPGTSQSKSILQAIKEFIPKRLGF